MSKGYAYFFYTHHNDIVFSECQQILFTVFFCVSPVSVKIILTEIIFTGVVL